MFSIAPLILNVRAQGGLGTYGEIVNPTNGRRGTTVTVNFNITDYVALHGSAGSTQDAYGTVYRIGWDIGGYPRDTAATLEEVRNPGWTVLGTVQVDRYGSISTTVRIPADAQVGDGHFIYAVPPDLESSVYYWSDSFHVTEGPVVPPPDSTSPSDTGSLYIDRKSDECTLILDPPGHVDHWDNYEVLAYYPVGTRVRISAPATLSYIWNWTEIEYPDHHKEFAPSWEFEVIIEGNQTKVYCCYIKRCVIVTATYGSTLSSEVVFMRSVRDDMIGSNAVGEVLVDWWNEFYYSWSPPIAGAIAGSNSLRELCTIALLPLLGTMHIIAYEYNLLTPISPAFASITSFLTAALLSILIYIALPTWGILTFYKRKRQGKSLSRLFFQSQTKS